MTEDEMAGWHHWLNEHVFELTPGVCDGQGGLASCDSRSHEELDMTEHLNWTELNTLKENEEIILIHIKTYWINLDDYSFWIYIYLLWIIIMQVGDII